MIITKEKMVQILKSKSNSLSTVEIDIILNVLFEEFKKAILYERGLNLTNFSEIYIYTTSYAGFKIGHEKKIQRRFKSAYKSRKAHLKFTLKQPLKNFISKHLDLFETITKHKLNIGE